MSSTEKFLAQMSPNSGDRTSGGARSFIKINTGCGKLSDFSPEREAARGTSVKSVLSFLISRMMRVFDVFPNNFTANIACGTNKIAARP